MVYHSNNTFGTLSSAPDGRIIEKVYSYVAAVLQNFEGNFDDNENHLTNGLCKKLKFRQPPEHSFFFHHQNIENSKENTSTDFAVFGTYAYAQSTKQEGEDFPLVKFEAKRLNSTLPKIREREYVLGEYESGKRLKNSGGIERFKNLRHGNDVHHACIIGYVQTESFTYWEEKVNCWIKEEISSPNDSTLTWDDCDYLRTHRSTSKVSRYISTPKRKGLSNLQMDHIWRLLN
ncbi:hypothetical protein [Algoriphagus aquimarinus]|uniref:hypothetical protein n=1 Tax=Algoriphagus aquimarinus TaxID=237018 RepID=UPI0030DC0CB5|tara:strand:- start:3961 stop:4656 length:696 start_codon:yes stop_codon:yes gene_type:complete